MAKGDAAESLGELGRWLEVLHRAAAAAALESWWSFCTRHSPHRTCRAHEALISMIECPFPAAVPLSPRPHEQTPSAAGRKADPFQAASTASKAPLSLAFSGRMVQCVLSCDPPAARLCCAPLFPLARTLQADRVCMNEPQWHPTLSSYPRYSDSQATSRRFRMPQITVIAVGDLDTRSIESQVGNQPQS